MSQILLQANVGFNQVGSVFVGSITGDYNFQPLQNAFSDDQSPNWADSVTTFLYVQLITQIQDALHDQYFLLDNFYDSINFVLTPTQTLVTDFTGIRQQAINSSTSGIPVTPSDSLVLSDGFTSLLTLSSTFTDSLSLSDSVGLNQALANTFGDGTDVISLTDSIIVQLNVNLTTVLTDSLSLSDVVSTNITESFNTYIRRYLNDVIRS